MRAQSRVSLRDTQTSHNVQLGEILLEILFLPVTLRNADQMSSFIVSIASLIVLILRKFQEGSRRGGRNLSGDISLSRVSLITILSGNNITARQMEGRVLVVILNLFDC